MELHELFPTLLAVAGQSLEVVKFPGVWSDSLLVGGLVLFDLCLGCCCHLLPLLCAFAEPPV